MRRLTMSLPIDGVEFRRGRRRLAWITASAALVTLAIWRVQPLLPAPGQVLFVHAGRDRVARAGRWPTCMCRPGLQTRRPEGRWCFGVTALFRVHAVWAEGKGPWDWAKSVW